MKKAAIAALLLTLAAPSLSYAAPQMRGANNEASCSDAGMGMDPRCVGDVDPSGETAAAMGAPVPDQPRLHAAQAPALKQHRNL